MARLERALSITRGALATRWAPASVALLLFASFGVACRSHAAASAEPASSASAGSAAPTAADTTVLLYANMGEAKDECVCGQMIRAVHAAAGKGVKVREVDTRDGARRAIR